MSKISEITPAFPVPELRSYGMELRDLFAAQALGGLCSNPDNINNNKLSEDDANWPAAKAYAIANAMLRIRGTPRDA